MVKNMGKEKRENLSNLVTRYIKDGIFEGKYTSNDQIKENCLAQELGISRAPVREAMKQLEREGVLYFIPNKGSFLVEITKKDRAEIFQIRVSLESDIIRILIEENRLTTKDFKKLEKMFLEMSRVARSDKEYIRKVIEIIKIDFEFHKYLWRKSESKHRCSILETLVFQLKMAMIHDTQLSNDLEESVLQHLDIIEALKSRNIDLAIMQLKNHIVEL